MTTTRKGVKPNQRARFQSQLEIGQLETTPTSRHLQSPQVNDNPDPPSTQNHPRTSADEFDDEVEDADLIDLAVFEEDIPSNQIAPGYWSEGGSTRPSSPAEDHGLNAFDSSPSGVDDFSSLRSGSEKLPSTQPLPSQLIADPPAGNKTPLVDFSETATTARRSSPYLPQTTLSQAALDLTWGLPENNTVPELPDTIPDSFQVPKVDPMDHLPEDELYDATPAPEAREELDVAEQPQHTEKERSPQKPTTKGKAVKSSKKSKDSIKVLEKALGPINEGAPSTSPGIVSKTQKRPGKNAEQAQESSGGVQAAPTTGTPKSAEAKTSGGRRGKQRAKPPLKFDERTQQIIEPPQGKVAKEPLHMPLVNNMRQAHAASTSPAESTKVSTPKAGKKAASKATSKGVPKTSPKTTAKTTPKVTQKAAPIATRSTTRQLALESKLAQQSPEEAEKVHNNASLIDHPMKSATKASPAMNKRTTANARGKPAPAQQPPKGLVRPMPNTYSQGSTNDPIVLSSGPGSSELSDADADNNDSVPANEPTEVSPVETLPTEVAPPGAVPRSQEKLLVDPVVDPEKLLHISRDKPERTVAPIAQKRTTVVKADPEKAPIQRTNREQPIRIGPREVLSARDANSLTQRNVSTTNTLKRPASTRDPATNTSMPPRKTSKVSRRFSVSQAGSPVPARTAPAEGISPGDEDDVKHPTSHSSKQASGRRRSQRLRDHAD